MGLINPVNAVDHHQDNVAYHPAHQAVHPEALPEDQAEMVAMEIS